MGYAVDDEEYREGVRGVAAAIWDHHGKVCAAINAGGPASRITRRVVATLAPVIVRAAAEVSRKLGYLPSRSATPAALPQIAL